MKNNAQPPPAQTEHEKKWKKEERNRALQNYLRNSYRTHISLSALADRKSNIMVRLNSLLIGLLLVFF